MRKLASVLWPVPLPQWWWAWAKWRLAAQSYPRPSTAPKVIPAWAWLRLAVFIAARTKTPPPLPPFDPFALWSFNGGWTAWGFDNGQWCDRLGDPSQMTAADVKRPFEIAKARGYRWLGVQDLPRTRAMKAALKAAAAQYGLKLVVWEWATTTDKALEVIRFWEPDGYAANVEHLGPWDELAPAVRGQNPRLPLAVWTNFAGAGAMPDGSYSLAGSRPWRDNQFACITEAYACENPQALPTLLDWTARTHLGYTFVVASIGVYNGWRPENYEFELKPFAGVHSVYLMEYLPEAQ